MGNKMAVTIKSQREIEIMREAGKILAFVHEELEKMVTVKDVMDYIAQRLLEKETIEEAEFKEIITAVSNLEIKQ